MKMRRATDVQRIFSREGTLYLGFSTSGMIELTGRIRWRSFMVADGVGVHRRRGDDGGQRCIYFENDDKRRNGLLYRKRARLHVEGLEPPTSSGHSSLST
eukprot:scaffold3100_cov203-Alexandrium_tamarense.AAC.22